MTIRVLTNSTIEKKLGRDDANELIRLSKSLPPRSLIDSIEAVATVDKFDYGIIASFKERVYNTRRVHELYSLVLRNEREYMNHWVKSFKAGNNDIRRSFGFIELHRRDNRSYSRREIGQGPSIPDILRNYFKLYKYKILKYKIFNGLLTN